MHRPLTSRCALALLATSPFATAQWAQKAPATSPSARVAAAMDYVPANNGLVLFGGSTSAPSPNAETWLYDGLDWTQLAPATSPPGRFGAQLIYDSARGVAVMYGGLATAISIPPPTNQTWEWNGTTWTQATPVANAGNRYRYGACFDSLRSRVVMFGGSTSQLGLLSNQTWEYEGTTWTQVTTVGNPGGRDRPAMCFHAGLGKAVLFGGASSSTILDDTWVYDGVAGTWTQLAITGPKPPARNAATLVYDSVRNLCVLTGGQDQTTVFGDTWVFDGVSWTQQPTTTQAVRDHMMAFLPTTRQSVKFGGFVSAPFTLSNQTWEFGSGIFGAGCPGTNGTPTLVAANAPLIGQTWTVNIGNLNPTFSTAILAFGFTQLPGIDLGFIGMPGCAAYTLLDLSFGVGGAGGTASWVWTPVFGLQGDAFYGQAFCLDPTVNALGFTVSNPIFATVGS